MVVIGADTHKRSHTVGAVDGATGRVLADRTVSAKRRSFEDLLAWGRGVGADRVWAIEDCRHVAGALERFLLRRGERVVRVAPKLMADTRRSARERGKSDVIDAVAIARAALREGLDTLPISQLAGSERDVRLLVDHRAFLVTQRTALINDLRWHPHDLSPELEIPPRALIGGRWQERVAGRLARAEQTAQVRTARDELRRIRELTRSIDALQRELAGLVGELAPRLLAEPGCGVLTGREADRRDRRHRALRHRRQARPPRRIRADPRQLRTHRPPPPRHRRQPPAQLRPAPPRRHQGTPRPRHRRLPRSPASRRQDPPRSPALPQAPPRPTRLAPASGVLQWIVLIVRGDGGPRTCSSSSSPP